MGYRGKIIYVKFASATSSEMNLRSHVNTANERARIDNKVNDLQYDSAMVVSAAEIQNAVKSLKLGRSAGPDGISAEHIRHGGSRMSVILALYISALFIHGCMPHNLMESILVPIVKNKNGNLGDISNYRMISVSNSITKLIELVCLHRYDHLLCTEDNQFGFRKKHGTEECVFALKEVVNYYIDRGSSVFVCFLDASKAFDRVNHDILFNHLINANFPVFALRLMRYLYNHMSMSVKWGNAFSSKITCTNGVKQGGVLSPKFFNIYMDELSRNLNLSNVGCKIRSVRINHLAYADDFCLIANSVMALQILLNICNTFGCDYDVVFNENKTKCMYFANKRIKHTLANVRLGNTLLSNVESEKYLGHYISSDLSDTINIRNQLKCFYVRANMILRKFSGCSRDVKLALIRAHCCGTPFMYMTFRG